jgi:malate dehydrogenase
MKITVVGAGNVGATCANVLAHRDAAHEVVLIDIKEGLAEGKALDIWQSAPIDRFNCRITGYTNNYLPTSNSNVVVITSGLPRKPGMTRDDLIGVNAEIVRGVTEQIIQYSPCAVLIIVSNPLDIMTYQAYLTSEFPRTRVIGMAGILDTGRFKAFIASELNVSPKDISALLLGGHGDTMVPLPRFTTVSGIPVTELLSAEKIEEITERTRFGGGEIVKLMGTSAWYAPGSSAAMMAEAVTRNHKRVFPCCIKLEGEYGLRDVFVGVPVVLGKEGVEKILQPELTDKERAELYKSAESVREMMDVLNRIKKTAGRY